MKEDIEHQLQQAQKLLDSYLDLSADQADDDTFIARGNGFANHKYSDDFLDMKIAQLTARIANLRTQLEQQ